MVSVLGSACAPLFDGSSGDSGLVAMAGVALASAWFDRTHNCGNAMLQKTTGRRGRAGPHGVRHKAARHGRPLPVSPAESPM